MAEDRVQRRLAAIISADVVGYSKMMGQDEAGTLARLKALRAEFLHPKVAEYGGRIVKTTGDGTLIEFGSAVDAVSHALDVQRGMVERNAGLPADQQIRSRLGINLGDIIIDGDDIFGDGVNVAARLEALAEPGGICISGTVYEHVRKKLDADFEDLGEQAMKNIADPIRVYRVRLERRPAAIGAPPKGGSPEPAKPAIAVLPFDNMSGDPEQEYFADGLTEDIITALTLWRSFPVIARNSTFTYKGRAVKVQDVAKELNARYVVEGSVRKGGNRVRVTGQLIDCETGNHLWAQRYDRDLEDIFALQDEITQTIVATLEPELVRAATAHSTAKPPADLDAWDYYLRGMAHLNEFSRDTIPHAHEMFERALEIDPGYARAAAYRAMAYHRELLMGVAVDPAVSAAKCREWADRALALDASDFVCHWASTLAFIHNSEPKRAIEEARLTHRINPNWPDSIRTLGSALLSDGQAAEAVPYMEESIRLNPLDPANTRHAAAAAVANFQAGNDERAIEWARQAISAGVDYADLELLVVAAHGHMEDKDAARAALREFNLPETIPETPPSALFRLQPHYHERLKAGLRKAGMTDA